MNPEQQNNGPFEKDSLLTGQDANVLANKLENIQRSLAEAQTSSNTGFVAGGMHPVGRTPQVAPPQLQNAPCREAGLVSVRANVLGDSTAHALECLRRLAEKLEPVLNKSKVPTQGLGSVPHDEHEPILGSQLNQINNNVCQLIVGLDALYDMLEI